MYTAPLLFATACSSVPPSRGADPCLPAAPKEKVLQPYYDFLSHNDKVVSAGKLCSFSPGLYDQLWNKLAEAEKTGLPPTAPIPQSFYQLEKEQVTIKVTQEEAYQIYAAHLAHSLWLEKKEIVPCSLLDYHEKQLEEILQPSGLFNRWDDNKKEYSFHLLLDNSPQETFAIATEAVPSFSTQKAAMIDIIRSTRHFRHGIAWSYDGNGNPTDDHDPQEIVTMKTMEQEQVSRHGCQTMSPYIIQLGKSLNIPGRYINGYYFGDGHRSALFEFTDQVLAHGDDVYGGNTPSSELMDSYTFWEKEVLSHPKGDPTAAHNTMVHNYKMYLKYPDYSMFYGYCKKGGMDWLIYAFIDEKFGPFATMEELRDVEKRIIDLSKNCTEFPKDKPDQ